MIAKLVLCAMGAYLFSACLMYLLMEIYAYDCRKKHALFVPTFTDRVVVALFWPYFCMFCG